MSNEYKISAIKDFLAVPPECIEACLVDFGQWMTLARNRAQFAEGVSTLPGIPSATAFSDDSFTWIDDGIVGISLVNLVDAESGEHVARISIEGEPQ